MSETDKKEEIALEPLKKLISEGKLGGAIGALLSPSVEDRYSAQLYLLKLYFSMFIYLLSTFCSGKLRFDSPAINDLYLKLCIVIEAALDSPGFEELKKMYHRPFETLLTAGGEADFDIEWECGYGQYYAQIQSKIDEMFILNGSKIFEIEKELNDFFQLATDAIKAYRADTEKVFAGMLKKIDADHPTWKGGDGEKPVATQNVSDKTSQAPTAKRYSTAAGDAVLDKHIVLGKRDGRACLLFNKEVNVYLNQIFIEPQVYNLIHFLYTMRNRESGFKLQEFEARGIVGSKKLVTMHKKAINKLCEKHGVKDIFYKFPEDKWGLNRELDCC